MEHSKDEVRELQYWLARSIGIPVDKAQQLDQHLCLLLEIDDAEVIEDPADLSTP